MQPNNRDPVSVQERQRWFRAARFGMFIHWGLHAVPGRGEGSVMSGRGGPLPRAFGLK
jgi:hypothetical protein